MIRRPLVALLAVCAVIAGAATVASAHHPTRTTPRTAVTKTILFSDSFNGRTLDKTKWNDTWGGDPSKGVNGSEDDCYASSQVNVGGGQLTLTAIKKPCLGKNWTSGLINTNGHFSFTTGTLRARVCLQGARTIDDWPGIWTDGQHWPNDGEIDLLEGLGGDGEWHVHSTSPTIGGGSLGVGCHRVKYVRTASSATFFYDGVNVGTASTASFSRSSHYLVLNLAVSPSISPPEVPAQMHVDWVQVTA